MYNISQLNELLVPELLDIAEQYSIPNYKKMNKQDLVDTIMDKQSQMADEKKAAPGEKPKRKRIAKDASVTESTESIKEDPSKKEIAPKHKKVEPEKKPVKKQKQEMDNEEEEEELQPLTDEDSSIPPAIAQMLQQEDIQQPEMMMDEPEKPGGKEARHFQQRKEQQPAFNIEFDGVVFSRTPSPKTTPSTGFQYRI